MNLNLNKEEMRFVIDAIIEKSERVTYDTHKMINDPDYLKKCKNHAFMIKGILDKLPTEEV